MKSIKLFLLFFSIIILNNCSHKEKIDAVVSAVVSPDQMIDYEGVVTSEKKHTVSLGYYDLGMLKHSTKFRIIVENYGDKPIDFSNDNISVMFEGNSIDWSSKKIKIKTPSDLKMDLLNEISALMAMNYRVNIQASGKIISSAHTTTLSELDPDQMIDYLKWVIEGQKEGATMANRSIRTKMAQSSYAVPKILIKPQIIMPNESMSVFFACDTKKMKNKVKGTFIISVRVEDEEHKFIFSRS